MMKGLVMRGRGKTNGRKPAGDEELNFRRFDDDLVLRVNVSSFADRLAIAELAEVQSPVAMFYVRYNDFVCAADPSPRIFRA